MKNQIIRNPNLHIVFSITLMAILGVASLSPVLPKVQQVFNLNPQQVGYVMMYFTLPGVFLTPFLGMLADRLGRKTVIIPSLFLFATAGVACGFMKSYEWLLVLRFVQGIGAASLGALNVTLVGDLFSGRDRAVAMGYNASVLSIGTALYPAIGGALAMIAWFYPFFIPALAIPVGLWVMCCLKNPEPHNTMKFWVYMKNTLKYLVQKEVIGLFILLMLTFIILYGSFLTYIPIMLGDRFNTEPYFIGIILSASSFATAIASAFVGKMFDRLSHAVIFIIAYVLYGISLAMIPFVSWEWQIFIPVIIFGVAQGINIPALQTVMANKAPLEYRGIFLSFNGMVLRIGQTTGPLLIGFVYLAWGHAWAFYTGGGIAVVMILAVLVFISGKRG